MYFKTKKIKQEFSNMKKLVWAKLKSPFSGTGRSSKERADSLSNKLNVNEEYKEAFRTKSYVEMWTKVHDQLRKTSIDGADQATSPSSSLPFYAHDLSEYLFEPQQQELLREMIESFKFHHLLVDYFESSLEACRICDLLLQCIEQTRADYRKITKVIKLSKRVEDINSANYADKAYGDIFSQLASYALLENPLSIFVSSVKFHDFHDSNVELLHGLTSERGKIRRKARIRRICMRVGGCCLVISHTALLIALLVIAIHGVVGIVAAPGIVGCSLFVFRKQIKLVHERFKTSLLEKRQAQLDLAAKGTYILTNDFDTLSRLVHRLFDEVEHRKALADMCVRTKKIELLKEVLKEFHIHHLYYLEQLEELERHIYLCFHTINRSRRLVTEEIMAAVDNIATDDQQKFL